MSIFTDKQIVIKTLNDTNQILNKSKPHLETEGEWRLCDIIPSNKTNNNDGLEWLKMHQLIYQVQHTGYGM